MITYRCNNRDMKTGAELPCTGNICETSTCPECKGRADASSKIYWCEECKVPLYEEHCSVCGAKGSYLATDIRPVFPEERLLVEIILGEPFCFEKDSVWNGTGNKYYVNGKKIPFSIKALKELDAEEIRLKYEENKARNR